MYNNRKYWLASSGGLDSTVLAHLLAISQVEFGIVHCNFKLRGNESDEDEKFVIELAKTLNVPIKVKVLEIDSTKNTQLAARKKRYHWFHKIIEAGSKVVLAHHKDDQEETFWIQLERGAGVAGLVGMTNNHKGFIRPLLKYTKSEILGLAQDNNWQWRDDQSNASTKYKRNFYRLELLPYLRKAGIKAEDIHLITTKYQTLFHLLQQLRLPEKNCIAINLWQSFPIIIRHEFLRRRDIAIHFEKEISKLCLGTKGSQISVTGDYHVWHNGGSLEFIKNSEKVKDYEIIIKTVQPNQVDFSVASLFFDAKKIKGEISARLWKKGDRFQPLGMKGKKTVSDFLTDKKVKSSEKRKVLILEDNEKIIGIYPFIPSELVKIDNQTKLILHVTVKELIEL